MTPLVAAFLLGYALAFGSWLGALACIRAVRE